MGIALTLAGLWAYTHVDDWYPGPKTAQQSPKAKTSAKAASRSSVAAATPRKSSSSARKEQQSARSKAAKTAASDLAASGIDGPASGLFPDANLDPAAGSAVASALIDLRALPYEESLNASLDERIRQVDYALMQAAWMRKIPASGMRLVSVEDRLEGIEPYQYQVIDILPGAKARPYIDALANCLSAWADSALLEDKGNNHWLIFVSGVQTHLIRLFPGKDRFPPAPGQAGGSQRPALPNQTPSSGKDSDRSTTRPNIDGHKRRAPGEAARLVIVIDDLGASNDAVRQLLALSYPVSCAFWPHGAHTSRGARAAHAAGREVLVHLPMQPVGYPKVRPGPNVLLVGMSANQIRSIIRAAVTAVPHASGLNNHMGSQFTQHAAGVDAVITEVQRQGLFLLDSFTHRDSVLAKRGHKSGVVTHKRDVFLDVVASRANILEELHRAERIALLTGQCIAIGHPLPETLAALKEWQQLRNKKIHIVSLRDLPAAQRAE